MSTAAPLLRGLPGKDFGAVTTDNEIWEIPWKYHFQWQLTVRSGCCSGAEGTSGVGMKDPRLLTSGARAVGAGFIVVRNGAEHHVWW